MRLRDSPYYITLLSGLLPIPAAFFDDKLFIYIPFILTAVMFFLLCIKNKLIITRGNSLVVALLFFIVFHGLAMSLTTGHGSGGLVGLVFTTIIFFQLLNASNKTPNPDRLATQVLVIYMVHVVYLYTELFLRVVGFESVLLSLLGDAQNVTKYKNYNSASFLWYVGFPIEFFGLNGMLLGSQSAGQVMACAVIVTAQWYKHSLLKGLKGWLLSIISLFAFLMAVNMSMLLTLSAVCFLMVYLIPNSRICSWFFRLFIPLILIAFSSEIIPLLLYRIDNFDTDVRIYTEAFGAPLEYLVDASLTHILFGSGPVNSKVNASDFGLGMLGLQVGIIFIVFCAIIFYHIIKAFIKETKYAICQNRANLEYEEKWLWLATINGLIAIIFAAGLIHYTPSIELGGLQLFSFSIAITIFSVKNLRKNRLLRS